MKASYQQNLFQKLLWFFFLDLLGWKNLYELKQIEYG